LTVDNLLLFIIHSNGTH